MSVDTSGLERLVHEFARGKLESVAAEFVDTAKGLAPRATGALAESIEAGPVSETGGGFSVDVTVGEPYGIYQEEGTGDFGPHGPVVPTSHEFLRFPAKVGPNPYVFVREVAGTEPTHFWARTVERWPQIVAAAA